MLFLHCALNVPMYEGVLWHLGAWFYGDYADDGVVALMTWKVSASLDGSV